MIPLAIFDEFPRLSTERLDLRPISKDDAEALFAIFSDNEVMRYWSRLPYTSIEEIHGLIDKIDEAYRTKAGIEWGIVEKTSGRLIGKCCYHRLMKEHFRAEVGYALSRDRWGQGFVREAVKAILELGFTKMGLHSVEAQLDPQNERSANALEKLGFLKEGHIRENFYIGGKFTDTGIYSLLASNYRKELR